MVCPMGREALRKLKSMGFSDERLAKLAVDAVMSRAGQGETQVASGFGLVA